MHMKIAFLTLLIAVIFYCEARPSVSFLQQYGYSKLLSSHLVEQQVIAQPAVSEHVESQKAIDSSSEVKQLSWFWRFLHTVQKGLQLPLYWFESSSETPVEDAAEDQSPVFALDLSQYEEDVVLRFNWTTKEEQRAFVKASETLILDLWSVSKTQGDVRIGSSRVKDFVKLLPTSLRNRNSRKVMIKDLQQAVFTTFPIGSGKPGSIYSLSEQDVEPEKELFFKDYRDLNTIYGWMRLLEATYPELVRVTSIGQTFEGREILAAHVGAGGHGDVEEKKTILITSAIHAREWISVSSSLFALYKLVTGYGHKEQETEYMNELDFLFVPVLNPDGYVYSWNEDRLWRKNRQETSIPICKGIDIDHSFDFHWQAGSTSPCSEAYAGSKPFEAVEAQLLAEYVRKTGADNHKYFGYLDWHSYSQEILYPYGFSCEEQPRDLENLVELAYGLAKAIRLSTGKHFDVLPACEDRDSLEDAGGGSSLDYFYHLHALWAFQIKLRDTGDYGFLLPRKYIGPSAKEMYSSLQYFCDFILHPGPP